MLRLKCGKSRTRIGRLSLGGTQLRLDALTFGEQFPIVFGERGAPFPIFQLASQVCDELLDELAAKLPQRPQLIEHQRRIAALLRPEPLLEGSEHLLHAGGSAFLLLDTVFETIDLVFELAVSFL